MRAYQIPSNRRYWVVRAEGGAYYQNFVQNSIVAIGHFDELEIQVGDTKNFLPDYEELRTTTITKAKLKELNRRQAASQFSQIKHFIFDIGVGDWVITVSSASIRVGLVTSTPYIENTPNITYHDTYQNNSTTMNFKLRRNVDWGPSISRANIPYGLQATLKANQTVFNVDKHVEAIAHTLYPSFILNRALHLSIRIRTKDEIKNQSMVSLLNFLNEIEIFAKESEHLTVENFNDALLHYLRQHLLTLTTKAQYHSPGDIWAKIKNIKEPKNIATALMLYGMIFGNSTAGMDGIMDLQTRQKIWDLVIHRINSTNIIDASKDLKLEPPKYDTQKLESLDHTQFHEL